MRWIFSTLCIVSEIYGKMDEAIAHFEIYLISTFKNYFMHMLSYKIQITYIQECYWLFLSPCP